MKKTARYAALGLVGAMLLVGCGGGSQSASGTSTTGAADARPVAASAKVEIPALPGLEVPPLADAAPALTADKNIVAARYGTARPDPFALKPAEKAFEIEQNTNRLIGQMGSWTVEYVPEPEKSPTEGLVVEPQPYRRLSGIIVGDSVYAIMDSEGGQPAEILRPGMKVPNTDWEVASIDAEKAVLRRKGNKLPRTVTVRLETPPPGMGPQNNTGPNNNAGPQGGPAGITGAGGGGKIGGGGGVGAAG